VHDPKRIGCEVKTKFFLWKNVKSLRVLIERFELFLALEVKMPSAMLSEIILNVSKLKFSQLDGKKAKVSMVERICGGCTRGGEAGCS
jgi:hypothetical protein